MTLKTNTRLPAEWEPQSAIMLTWPHSNTDWRDTLAAVENVYFDIASAILGEQNLLLSCEDSITLERVRTRLEKIADQSETTLMTFEVPADDTWARDHGPIGVLRDSIPVLLDFTFNAWGDKYASNKDNLINQALAEHGAFSGTALERVDFVLEGGSIESDGQGTLLTTEHCLLQETRNQQLTKSDIEASLKRELGVSRVLWLSAGYLQGDDTDAHIDTLARFVDINTICYVSCDDPRDPHFQPLQQMALQLADFRTSEGKPYRLVPLPMPSPAYNNDKERLPATYANFLITNHSILLPTYGCLQDEAAVAILDKCFPDRKIVPINCLPLIEQHGSLHCVTMQLTKGVCE